MLIGCLLTCLPISCSRPLCLPRTENYVLRASLACCFCFALALHAGLLIALSALNLGKDAGFLDFLLETL